MIQISNFNQNLCVSHIDVVQACPAGSVQMKFERELPFCSSFYGEYIFSLYVFKHIVGVHIWK